MVDRPEGNQEVAIQRYLHARLIDEAYIAYSPVFLGSGEAPFAGVDVVKLGYEVAEHVATQAATHVVLKKRA